MLNSPNSATSYMHFDPSKTNYLTYFKLVLFASQRDAINEILQYASKSRLPENLREQMLAHMQLKFKTAELKQEEVLGDLPKAIRSSIAQHLFHRTVENVYLFNGVSDDLITQLVIFLGVFCAMLINNIINRVRLMCVLRAQIKPSIFENIL